MKETKTETTKMLWAACLDFNQEVLVGKVGVTETKKQFQVLKGQKLPMLAPAYHYASVVNKFRNKVLFETKKQALQMLFDRLHRTMVDTANQANVAYDNWLKASRALEEAK